MGTRIYKNNKIITSIIALFCFLLLNTNVKAQPCVGCPFSTLYEQVEEEDNFFDVYVENKETHTKYISNSSFPVRREWIVENDTVRTYLLVITGSDSYVDYINENLDKKYIKFRNDFWVILDKQIQIELHCINNNYTYIYTQTK